jgi:hypothetical protein
LSAEAFHRAGVGVLLDSRATIVMSHFAIRALEGVTTFGPGVSLSKGRITGAMIGFHDFAPVLLPTSLEQVVFEDNDQNYVKE